MRRPYCYLSGLAFGLAVVVGFAGLGLCAQEAVHPEGPPAVNPPLHGLQLAGTVEGADRRLMGAVFEDPRTKKQTAYRIGDHIDGATIVEIKRQQVVLKRGEEYITVQITGGSPVAGQASGEPGKRVSDDTIPVPAGDPQVARQAVISKVIPPYDPRIEKAKTTVSREDVARFVGYFQDRLKEERSALVSTSLGPAVDLGGVDLEILDSLKLESTDRIVEISGMDVNSPRRFTEILEILGRAKIVDISVLRGDVIQPLYYTVN